jgi:hypothetical protein
MLINFFGDNFFAVCEDLIVDGWSGFLRYPSSIYTLMMGIAMYLPTGFTHPKRQGLLMWITHHP